MTKTHILRRSFLIFVTAIACQTVSGFANGPAPERDQRRFEINFLTEMIDHHFGAIKMSELCDGRTVHAELHQMCDEMKAAQAAEITMMQGWLQSWYGVSHTPTLDRKMQRRIDALAKLSGAAFEKAFMAMMIPHHAEAIERSRDCLLQAYHAEMLNMCAKMLGAQGDEIAMMRLWLIEWYGINDLDRNDRA